MQLDATKTGHINELLALVVAFTKAQRQVLTSNIRNMDRPGYFPTDLPSEAFSQAIDSAISEYLVHERIVLCDTDTIRFGSNMSLELESIPDAEAYALLLRNRQGYVAYQTRKLLENALNEKIALWLLKRNQRTRHAPQRAMRGRHLQ